MAKFFQTSDQPDSSLFDQSGSGGRINGGRQYSEHPYEGTLLRGLDELRKSGVLCDIKLIVESKEFDAHKSVLASCSTYFRVMFTTSMIEKEKDQIEIKDISTEGLDAVLKFIYTNTINITRNNIHDILHAATLLQVEPVIRFCYGVST